jgi:HIRAN domain
MAVPKNQVTREFSIMGSSFVNGASALINRLRGRMRLELRREPNNAADPNAVMVLWGNRQLGWIPRGLAKDIAPLMDSGIKVIAQKAPTALYGVCQLAYVKKPEPEPAQEKPEGTPRELDIDDTDKAHVRADRASSVSGYSTEQKEVSNAIEQDPTAPEAA